MTESEVRLLNVYEIDWCFNCAVQGCKTDKQKMFAWIVVNLARSMDLGNFLLSNEHLEFRFNTTDFEENEAIKKFLHNKKYWNFLKEICYNHIITHHHLDNREQVIAANNPKITFLNDCKNIVCLEYKL
jgi:hypothetical protein